MGPGGASGTEMARLRDKEWPPIAAVHVGRQAGERYPPPISWLIFPTQTIARIFPLTGVVVVNPDYIQISGGRLIPVEWPLKACLRL